MPQWMQRTEESENEMGRKRWMVQIKRGRKKEMQGAGKNMIRPADERKEQMK